MALYLSRLLSVPVKSECEWRSVPVPEACFSWCCAKACNSRLPDCFSAWPEHTLLAASCNPRCTELPPSTPLLSARSPPYFCWPHFSPATVRPAVPSGLIPWSPCATNKFFKFLRSFFHISSSISVARRRLPCEIPTCLLALGIGTNIAAYTVVNVCIVPPSPDPKSSRNASIQSALCFFSHTLRWTYASPIPFPNASLADAGISHRRRNRSRLLALLAFPHLPHR